MKDPTDLALELLEAFDADYDTRRQTLVDALVTAGLLVAAEPVDEIEAEDTPSDGVPWPEPITVGAQVTYTIKTPRPAPEHDTTEQRAERVSAVKAEAAKAKRPEQPPVTRRPLIATQEQQIDAVLHALDDGRSPVTALTDIGYTYGSATVLLKNLRKKGLVPQSERKAAANLPRPGFDLDAARAVIADDDGPVDDEAGAA